MGTGASKRVYPTDVEYRHVNGTHFIQEKRSEHKYAYIDEYALNMPESVKDSEEAVIAYLCKPATDKIDKIRAFYTWIKANKEYLQSEENSERNSSVGLCKSIATKFEIFCRNIGIKAKVIDGLFRDPNNIDRDEEYDTNTPENHSWNIVFIKGKWQIVDCACGSINDSQRSELYFLSEPEVFINSHYPSSTNDCCQLLQTPISLVEFGNSVKFSEIPLAWGVRLVSPNTRILHVQNTVDITVNDQRLSLSHFFATLQSEDGLEQNGYVLISKTENNYLVATVRPPSAGRFCLYLEGSTKQSKIVHFCKFTLVCTVSERQVNKFPMSNDSWGYRPTQLRPELHLISKTNAFVEANDGTIELLIQTKKTIQAYASLRLLRDLSENLDNYTETESYRKKIRIRSNFPKRGFYRLCVFFKIGDLYFPVFCWLIESHVENNTASFSIFDKDIMI